MVPNLWNQSMLKSAWQKMTLFYVHVCIAEAKLTIEIMRSCLISWKSCHPSSTPTCLSWETSTLKGINWEDMSCPDQELTSLNHQFIECIRDCFFFQHVAEPTRQRGTDNPSTLDLIFTNEENMIENLVYEAPLGKSHHAVLHFTFICQLPSAPPSIKVQYEKGNYTKLNEVLSRVDWISEFSQYPNDVEKQWSFSRINMKKLNKHMCLGK